MSKLKELINEITEDEWRSLKFQNDMIRTWAEDLNEKNKNKSDFKPFELKEEKILSDKLYKILSVISKKNRYEKRK